MSSYVEHACVSADDFDAFARLCAGSPETFFVSGHAELRGRSLENDYILILDAEDDPWWTLTVFTRELERAYSVRHLSAYACVCQAAEEFLKIRRDYVGGGVSYNYGGVWYAAQGEEVSA